MPGSSESVTKGASPQFGLHSRVQRRGRSCLALMPARASAWETVPPRVDLHKIRKERRRTCSFGHLSAVAICLLLLPNRVSQSIVG